MAVAVVGTGSEARIAERLTSYGARISHVGPVRELRRINGRARVTSIDMGRTIPCDAVVHCGPWRADPGLDFQGRADGLLQLSDRFSEGRIEHAGSALQNESIFVPPELDPRTRICPCMDVTAGELLRRIDAGETDPEVLKRLTSCGMGPCQGLPCWEVMIAILADRTGRPEAEFQRPSHRPPRRAITVAQAAGLHDVVEPDR
jgi:hypothetical protein